MFDVLKFKIDTILDQMYIFVKKKIKEYCPYYTIHFNN